MTVRLNFNGSDIVITTEHAASSYGMPVVLVDGQLTDIAVSYEAGEQQSPSILDVVANTAGVWNGPRTRADLAGLAAELYPGGITTGEQADAVIALFRSRGAQMRAAESV